MKKGVLLLVLALLGCGGSSRDHASTPSAPSFVILSSPSGGNTFANAITADGGEIVGGDLNFPNGSILFTRAGATTVVPTNTFSVAQSITPDGTKLLGVQNGAPAVYMIGGSVQVYPLPAGYSNGGVAAALNADILLASAQGAVGSGPPYVVVDGNARILPDLGTNVFTQASTLSLTGQVAAGGSGDKPVRWTNFDAPTVSALTDNSGFANDLSQDGSVIVGRMVVNAASVPFRWTQADGAVALPLPTGASGGDAVGVSADGSVVLGNGLLANSSMGEERPFVWTKATGSRRIEDFVAFDGAAYGGMTDVRAVALSKDGKTVIGTGTLPGGNGFLQRGFVLSIP